MATLPSATRLAIMVASESAASRKWRRRVRLATDLRRKVRTMSISKFALGEAALAQPEPTAIKSKTPPKRILVALADATVVPEPR